MSERAWQWAWRCRGLTPARRLVLLALAEHADDNGETCIPSLHVVGRMTGLSRRGLAKTLNGLALARLIARECGGCDGATRYRLLPEGRGSAPNSLGTQGEGGAEHGP